MQNRNFIRLVVVCFLFLFSDGFSQDAVKDFNIPLLKPGGSERIYKKSEFIDSRKEPWDMGFVQVGAFNKKAIIITIIPLEKQIEGIAAALIDSTLPAGLTFVIQFRKLSFAEITSRNEFGYFAFRANLYRNAGDVYQPILAIDTTIVIQAADVTKELINEGGSIISDFIARGLRTEVVDTTIFSRNELMKIDSVEKSKIPAYTISNFVDGIYLNYGSFSKQVPDSQIHVDSTKGRGIVIRSVNKLGETTRVKPNQIFAYVRNGQPFIANHTEFCRLVRKAGKFRFIGTVSVSPNVGEMVAIGFLGAAGGLVAASSDHVTFEMELDHIKGAFVKIRALK